MIEISAITFGSALVVVQMALLAVALVYAALLTLQTYEFRRFARSRVRSPTRDVPTGRVLVVAPCRGFDRQLPANLRALFQLDHPDFELLFVVDSQHDSACPAIRRLMDSHPGVAARLLVAGTARNCGQKVHNLLAATAELSPKIGALAFVDSDVRVRPDWLRRLTQHITVPGVAAATAYRWLVPRRSHWANLVAHSLDASAAALMGPGKHHLVWGGSWAISRQVFDDCQLRAAWQGTLSDDLVAARVLARAGRIEFEPAAIVATEVDFNFAGLWQFARRQFSLGRIYAPGFWAAACLLSAAQSSALLLGVAVAAWGAVGTHGQWNAAACLGTAGAGVLYGLQMLRAWMRQDAAGYFLPELQNRLAAARRADIWGGPLMGLVQWAGLWSALASRRITWRGIAYELAAGGRVLAVCQADGSSDLGGWGVGKAATAPPSTVVAARLSL